MDSIVAKRVVIEHVRQKCFLQRQAARALDSRAGEEGTFSIADFYFLR